MEEIRASNDTHLYEALRRIDKAGLTLNRDKCQFSKSCIQFLGQKIDSTGIHPDPDKVSAIRDVKEPRSVSDVRRFLGMCNQMSKFIPNLAEKTRVLRELLLKEREWTWELAQREAFSNLKEILSVAPVLSLYDPNAETIVSADASNFGLGAVLLQKKEDGETKPIACVQLIV